MERFPSEFLDRIQDLRGIWHHSGGSLLPGAVPGSMGTGLEFREHGEYRPGDEPRHVDWNATARLGRPFTKRFSREEARCVECLVDATVSMDFGLPSKLDAALRAAAAVALLAVLGGARARVHLLGGGGEPIEIRRWVEARATLERLELVEASGGAGELERALLAFEGHRGERGGRTLWLFSDYYDWELWVAGLERVLGSGLRPVLWQVLAPQELAPGYQGALELVDSESGERRSLVLDAETRRSYLTALRAFLERVEAFASRHMLARQFQRSDEEELELLARRLGAGRRG